MPYEILLKQGKIKTYNARPEELKNLFRLAERDLAASRRNLAEDPDWAYTIAYNAVLQALRGLMLAEGYRPRGSEHHATVGLFAQEALGKLYPEDVAFFDQMRRKRHRVVYDQPALIGSREAEEALEIAARFVGEIRQEVRKLTRESQGRRKANRK